MSDLSGPLVEQLKDIAGKIGEEKAKADAIFTSIGDGAIATDEKGNIVRINQIALNMLGCSEADVIDHWYPKVIDAENAFGKRLSSIELPITRSILEGKPVSQNIFYRRKDGSVLPVSVTVSPVLLDNKPVGAIEVFRDITAEVELARSKEEFISLASHQLLTPPTAIKWNLEVLRGGTAGSLNEDQKNIVADIYTINSKMIETVSALLNISRLDMGTFIVNPKPLSYVDIAKETVGELKSKIAEKNLRVEEDYGADVPVVPADPGLARIILDNLVGNAVKYTPPGGSIKISVSLEKKEDNPNGLIAIKVSDSGVGIPQAQQSKIFSKMFRASNVREINGTGFGLYIVKSIVGLAGGKIWFESIEGKGTTFYINLSLAGMSKKEGTSNITQV